MTPDVDAVTRLIHQVSAECILPRFRSLRAGDVRAKASVGDVEDIVTIADQEAEAALTSGLAALSNAPVVGEEAVAHDPTVLDRLRSDGPLWIVDPLDGTKNFAAGDDGFGVMVSYVTGHVVRAAWLHLPVRQQTFVAESGGGAHLNGQRLYVLDRPIAERPTGTVFVRFMAPDLRAAFNARLDGHYEPVAANGAAVVEYTDVLCGSKDFVIYYRLLPWDHGAPALILTEGGGAVTHLDGASYSIGSPNQVTIVARAPGLTERIRGWSGGAA